MEVGEIAVRSGAYVDSIEILYRDKSTGQLVNTPRHGGSGGAERRFVLDAGEFITQANGRTGAYVDSLTLVTNKGRVFGRLGGSGGGADYSINEGCGSPGGQNLEVFALFGRAGAYVNALGFHTRERQP